MEYSTQLCLPKTDCLYHEEQYPFSQDILEVPPLDAYFEVNLMPLSYHNNQIPQIDFKEFEDYFNGGLSYENDFPSLCEATVLDEKPQKTLAISFGHGNSNPTSDHFCELSRMIGNGFSNLGKDEESTRSSVGKRKSKELKLDEIQKYFNLPIKEAAKRLKVGVTRLKKRCRELNISRWPHRKLSSIKHLISNVKKMGLNKEIMMLEEQKRLLEEVPNTELTEQAKKLRQACFKATYKNKRSLAARA